MIKKEKTKKANTVLISNSIRMYDCKYKINDGEWIGYTCFGGKVKIELNLTPGSIVKFGALGFSSVDIEINTIGISTMPNLYGEIFQIIK